MWISLLRALALAAFLAIIVALGGATRAASDAPGSVSSYYIGRGDPRACPSPQCGGAWVRLVNKKTTTCGDGVIARECYVAYPDFSELRLGTLKPAKLTALISEGRALARGSVVRGRTEGFADLDVLVVTEVWTASSSTRAPVGVFRRLRDNGVRCITTPCFSIHAASLNSGAHDNVSRIDLAGTGAPPAERRRALAWIATTGLMGAGRVVREPNAGPGGAGRSFTTTQFYSKVAPPISPR
jgi:hypothetical protein